MFILSRLAATIFAQPNLVRQFDTAMSIGKRVREALDRQIDGDHEAALIPACIAVAASAEKAYPHLKRDNEKYKLFLSDNHDIIMLVAFGIPTQGVSFKFSHDDIRQSIVPGMATLEEILYHVVRCRLIHDGELDPAIHFGQSNEFGLLDNEVVIPPEIIDGLVMAVVGSGCNKNERLPGASYHLIFHQSAGDVRVEINSLWGQKAKLLQLLGNTKPKWSSRA